MGDRGGPGSRNHKVALSNPPSANPQSAQSLGVGVPEVKFLRSSRRSSPDPRKPLGRWRSGAKPPGS
eukprot:15210764-Alexandrium_andersonii.AAC.1